MQNRLISIWLILCMVFSVSVIGGYAQDSIATSDKPNLGFAKAMGFVGQDKNGSDTFSRGDLVRCSLGATSVEGHLDGGICGFVCVTGTAAACQYSGGQRNYQQQC